MSTENANQFIYSKGEGGYIITHVIGDSHIKKLVIPETYQGEPVIDIAQNALSELYGVEEVTIPASIKRVGSAFRSMYTLRKVNCLSNDIVFDKHAFNMCYRLEDLPFFAWKQVCSFPFEYLPLLRYRFTQEASFTKEEKEELLSFILEDPRLVKYIFTEGLASVMSFLIREGLSLTLVQLSEHLEQQIDRCNTLATAILLEYREKNFTKDEVAAFIERQELLEIGLVAPTFAELSRKWLDHEEEGVLKIVRYIGNKSEERMPSLLDDGRKILSTHHIMNGAYEPLKKLVIEEGFLTLDEETFCRSKTLEEVILPESLESMGYGCFAYCKSLKSITIPKNVKELPKDCFSDCFELEEVTLSEGLISIGDYAFADCKKLKEIILPKSLKELKQGTKHWVEPLRSSDDYGIFFKSGLESITIPPQVMKIPNFAFYGCSALKEVHLHENITDIGKGAFKFTPLLANDQGFVIFNNIFFDYTQEESVCVVPDHVVRISCKAFVDALFDEIILPDGLLEIEERAFWHCPNLKKIVIPPSVNILPKNGIDNCKNLEEVVVSSSTTVEEGALKNCPLAKIVVK